MTGQARTSIVPVRLAGYGIVLQPLSDRHKPGLARAASDSRIWQHMPVNLGDDGAIDTWLKEADRKSVV